MVASPPKGTVTFLFTDIEGSTKLWERGPEAMSEALPRHDKMLRESIEIHDGHVFKTMGTPSVLPFRPLRTPWKPPWSLSAGSSPPNGGRPGPCG